MATTTETANYPQQHTIWEGVIRPLTETYCSTPVNQKLHKKAVKLLELGATYATAASAVVEEEIDQLCTGLALFGGVFPIPLIGGWLPFPSRAVVWGNLELRFQGFHISTQKGVLERPEIVEHKPVPTPRIKLSQTKLAHFTYEDKTGGQVLRYVLDEIDSQQETLGDEYTYIKHLCQIGAERHQFVQRDLDGWFPSYRR